MLARGHLRSERDPNKGVRVFAADVEEARDRVRKATMLAELIEDSDHRREADQQRHLLRESHLRHEMETNRKAYEGEVTGLRAEIARLRGALESLLVSDAAKHDAIAQLVTDVHAEEWTR